MFATDTIKRDHSTLVNEVEFPISNNLLISNAISIL